MQICFEKIFLCR